MKLKSKIYLSREVSNRLSILAGRTGMLPNILCRIGFCLSLAEPTIPQLMDFQVKTQENQDALTDSSFEDNVTEEKESKIFNAPKEFNRYTLTGEWELLFFALLRERCAKDGLDVEAVIEDQFMAHLNRGVLLLFDRVKTFNELGRFFKVYDNTSDKELLPKIAGSVEG